MSLFKRAKDAAQDAIKEVNKKELKQGVKKVKDKVIIANAKKKLSEFYSDENFAAIKSLIDADMRKLTSPNFAPSRNDLLRGRDAILKNQPAIAELNEFNYFSLQKELKIQEQLFVVYPGATLKSTSAARYEELKQLLSKLESSLITVFKRKHIEEVLNSKIAKNNAEIAAATDLQSLILK